MWAGVMGTQNSTIKLKHHQTLSSVSRKILLCKPLHSFQVTATWKAGEVSHNKTSMKSEG